MKKFILCFGLLFISLYSHAEVLKFRTYGCSIRSYDKVWGNWSDFEESNLLVVFDEDNARIKIYNELGSTFDVIQDLGVETVSNSVTRFTWQVVDEEGITCMIIKEAIIIKEDGEIQILYIGYESFIVAFLIRRL